MKRGRWGGKDILLTGRLGTSPRPLGGLQREGWVQKLTQRPPKSPGFHPPHSRSTPSHSLQYLAEGKEARKMI